MVSLKLSIWLFGDARVPLRMMFGYSTDLRSLTKGRAHFTMSFHSFDKL